MKITIISSSTRTGRVSHRIALALAKQIEKIGHQAAIIDLLELDLPRFEERYPKVEEKPEKWEPTMELLLASDGLIFLTPEYNGSFSSGLKNFIDVFAKQGFREKPIAVATGSSGKQGGIRAAYQLQQVILSLFAFPLPRMLTVGEMQDKFNAEGELIDEDFRDSFEGFVNKFINFTATISSS
jgi:NAD(P)H-dependent FMN reductase